MVMISSEERRNSLFLATLAKEAGRHEEAFNLVKKLARLNLELTSEEQRLLSISLKHVINARRSALVSLSSSSSSEEVKSSSSSIKLMNTNYKDKIESELSTICSDMIDMIDAHLIPLSSTKESNVFYYKLKGDCYRYVLEYFKTGSERKVAVDAALEAYKEATSIANSELSPAHPIRLGLGLNFSVFYYEIMKSPMEACFLAREALDEADTVIDNLSEEAHEESNLLMKLLEENISLFASDITEKDLAVYARRPQNHSKLLGGN